MKKLFIFIISLFVCIGVFQTRVKAEDVPKANPDDDDYEEWLAKQPVTADPVSDEDSYYGGLPNPYIIETNYYDIDEFGKDLPSSYLTADNTYNQIYNSYETANYGPGLPTRDRTDFGISWAQAICGSAEYSYNHLHGQDPASPYATNMSEMHLAWFSYNNNGTKTTKTGKDVFSIGGSPIMSTLALTNGVGFVKEDKFPLGNKDQYSNKDLTNYTKSANAYNPDFVLNKAEWYTLKTEQDRVRVKDALMTNGPIAITLHLSDNLLKGKRYLSNFNGDPIETTNTIERKVSIYMSDDLAKDLGETTEPNYGAIIIGWDDDYSKKSFNVDLMNVFSMSNEKVPGQDYTFAEVNSKGVYWKTNTSCQPEKNGAWVVQAYPNSSQTYYVSYEDASITKSIGVYFEADDAKDNIVTHQLDNNSGFNYYEDDDNEAIFYNVYKPQSKEYIDSVGLFTYQKDVNVDLVIFAGDFEKTSLEEISDENYICIKRNYTIANPGFHRFDFKGLNGGNHLYNNIDYAGYQDGNIYVILKYTSPEGTRVLIPVDGEEKSYGNFSQVLLNKEANNTSILVANKGNKDIVTLAGAPAKIKLYTVPVDNKIIYHDIPEGVDNPNPTFYKTNGTSKGQLEDLVWEGHEFVGWFKDKDYKTLTLTTPGSDKGNFDLYPAFKQRIVLKYKVDGEDAEEIIHVNNYEDKLASIPNIEVKSLEVGKEFAGWEYTDSKGGKHVINIYDGSYMFEDIKYNGEDIVLTPLFEKVEPKTFSYTSDEIAEMTKDLDDKGVILVSPGSPQIISVVNADELTDATKDDEDNSIFENKAVLWFEATEITKTEDDSDEASKQYEGFKEIFEKIVENITYKVCKLIDINVFSQEEGESEGTKVAELTKKVSVEYDLSGDENAELREAAENGKLQISQMHNGEILDIDSEDIEYDKETMKLKFKVQKFSIFAFTVGTPTPADTPSGESGDTPTGGDTTGGDTSGGSDTNKSTENKSTENKSTDTTTPNPDFKTPNTGIY